MRESSLFGSAEAPVVGSCLGETQGTIGPTPDHVGVLVVLPIIFPKTDRTDVIAAALGQCLAATARAPVRARFSSRLANGMVVQLVDVPLEPPFSLFEPLLLRVHSGLPEHRRLAHRTLTAPCRAGSRGGATDCRPRTAARSTRQPAGSVHLAPGFPIPRCPEALRRRTTTLPRIRPRSGHRHIGGSPPPQVGR